MTFSSGPTSWPNSYQSEISMISDSYGCSTASTTSSSAARLTSPSEAGTGSAGSWMHFGGCRFLSSAHASSSGLQSCGVSVISPWVRCPSFAGKEQVRSTDRFIRTGQRIRSKSDFLDRSFGRFSWFLMLFVRCLFWTCGLCGWTYCRRPARCQKVQATRGDSWSGSRVPILADYEDTVAVEPPARAASRFGTCFSMYSLHLMSDFASTGHGPCHSCSAGWNRYHSIGEL